MKRTLHTLFVLLLSLSAAQAQIVITEIMYNPPPSGTDTLEYVELYNNSNQPVDLSGWQFNQGFDFTFPAGTTLQPGAYVVVTENLAYFQARFPGVTAFQWDGALTNTGEDIELTTADTNQVIDYVNYLNAAPWPSGANGTGSSLVLCNYNADNNDPANWQAATTPTGVVIGGTPVLANPGAASGCSTGGTVYTQHTIAEITGENAEGVADSINATVQISGTVAGGNLRPGGLQFTLIDDTNSAGIAVFNPTGDLGYTVQEGDELTIFGRIQQFNGLTQIVPDSIALESNIGTLAPPAVVAAPSEATESRLITINNLTLVDPAEWLTGMGTGFSVRAVTPDGDTVVIRIDNDVDLFNQPAPTGPFNLTGIGGQFDNSSPYTGGYQIAPRYAADLSPISATHQADFSAQVRLWPNPAADRLWLQTALDFDAVQILSPLGQPVMTLSQPARQTEVSLAGLPAGLYSLRFAKDGGVWTTRLVVTR